MIYLDHAATTQLCDAARTAVLKHMDDFGNPSSNHALGREARLLIEDARERIAKCINADADGIIFTSGGSEANTLALNEFSGSLTTVIEHHSMFKGIPTGVYPEFDGIILPESFKYKRNNGLVSCMYVNNEIGTIQPVKEIADIVHSQHAFFHTDAVQAVGHIPVDVCDIGCNTLSASGHKFGAMKGTGFLFVGPSRYSRMRGIILGGSQEHHKRPGTENVLGIISMAAALEDAVEHMEERNKHILRLRDIMLEKLLAIRGSYINGSMLPGQRVASNINIRFDGVQGQRLVTLCSLYGICISEGSACNEGSPEPSHVLKAIGLNDEEAYNSVRITIGHENTEAEILQAANIITKLVAIIREDP